MVVSRVESAKLEFKVALNVQDQRVDLPLTCNYSDLGRLKKEKHCNNWHIPEWCSYDPCGFEHSTPVGWREIASPKIYC